MGILVAIGTKLAQWLITLGAKALGEALKEYVHKKKQAKIDKPNLEQAKEHIEKKEFDKAAEDMVRLANGNKKK